MIKLINSTPAQISVSNIVSLVFERKKQELLLPRIFISDGYALHIIKSLMRHKYKNMGTEHVLIVI